MLTNLFYFLVLVRNGLSLSRGDDLSLAREATEVRRQCLEDGEYCWDPEECCTGAMISYLIRISDLILTWRRVQSPLATNHHPCVWGVRLGPWVSGELVTSDSGDDVMTRGLTCGARRSGATPSAARGSPASRWMSLRAWLSGEYAF